MTLEEHSFSLMGEPKTNEQMEKIVSLCKRRGFIYQSSEIYGGINGFWDYGPLGAELKRNVKELWWNTMTRMRDDVVGLEATIIMAPEIWKASGHVETFADPMCDCKGCNKRFRADQIEPLSGNLYRYPGALDLDYIANLEQKHGLGKGVVGSAIESMKVHESLAEVGTTDPLLRPALQEVWDQRQARGKSFDTYAVLLPAGKPPESAEAKARQFYIKRGLKDPVPFHPITIEKVENSNRFCNECGSELSEPKPFNLMFKTYVGPVESEDSVAYLRPETAQAIFAQFKNVLETSRQKVPFGIAQIGKAFRNEVTPRNYTFRSREFEQMELEFFIRPDEAVEAIAGHVASPGTPHSALRTPNSDWGWEAWHKYWVEERMRFYEGIGLPRTTLVEYWQKPDELAHYARATVDILFKFPFSKRDEKGELMGEELEGVAARSDFDLSQHERFSGKPMGVFDDELRAAWAKLDDAKKKELWERYHDARYKYLTKVGLSPEKAEKASKENADGLAKGQYIPHVIEPSAGVDRLILALICNAYYEDQMPDEKGKMETRVVLKFHPRVAPIKVGILPLLKNKPDLVKKALEIRDTLRPHMNVYYDDGGAIGRRYRRQDEAGTPFCVTVDFETLEGAREGALAGQKDTVTVRYRDDARQERVKITELQALLMEKIR